LNETPEGVRLLKELLMQKGRIDVASRVRYSPHPIMEEVVYDPAVKKEKRIIAVGRWDNYQKNAPLLIRTLEAVLAEYSDYEAHLFGGGQTQLVQLKQKLPEDIHSRIVIRGIVDHAALISEYQKSRIFFAPSRSESFNIAAAEALACGCSVVGSGHVFSFRNFVSKNSGTVSGHYNRKGLNDALQVELCAWDGGLRDALLSSRSWKQEVGADEIVAVVIGVMSLPSPMEI
jgi:glycosyltransferase involved in cell wall biosynthesis